jgi:hypothetical protein
MSEPRHYVVAAQAFSDETEHSEEVPQKRPPGLVHERITII